MDSEDQLKLQSYLDGELPEGEAREVANWLARDREAVALLAELRHTRQALAGFEKSVRLPEAGDFYWSKIQREIERTEPAPPEPVPVSWLARLRQLLMPASAIAVLVIAGLLVFTPRAPRMHGEISLADTAAFTYRDYAAGATLVWLSYPADDDLADDEDFFSIQ